MIISIDPGYERFGVAILDRDNLGKNILVHSECIMTKKTESYPSRVRQIGTQLIHIIEQFKPETLAIETVFFTTNQKTALKISEIRGMVIFIVAYRNMPLIELTPLEVKMSITGYGKATKDQILYMLPHLIKLDPVKKYIDDELDAIAIGIASYDYKHKKISP